MTKLRVCIVVSKSNAAVLPHPAASARTASGTGPVRAMVSRRLRARLTAAVLCSRAISFSRATTSIAGWAKVSRTRDVFPARDGAGFALRVGPDVGCFALVVLETALFTAVRLFATTGLEVRPPTEFLADALPFVCCPETSFLGALLETGLFAATFLAVGVPPAPGFLVAVLAVLAFCAESRDGAGFLAATFDDLIFALAAPTVGFLGFADTPLGRETSTSPRVERPGGRDFDAFTIGCLVGLLRWFVAMGTTLGET